MDIGSKRIGVAPSGVLAEARRLKLLDETEGIKFTFMPVIPPHVCVDKMGGLTLTQGALYTLFSHGLHYSSNEVHKLVKFLSARPNDVAKVLRCLGRSSESFIDDSTGCKTDLSIGNMISRCLGGDGERIDAHRSGVIFPAVYQSHSSKDCLFAVVVSLIIVAAGWFSIEEIGLLTRAFNCYELTSKGITGMPGIALDERILKHAYHTCRRVISSSLLRDRHHH
eukprot:GHVR01127860.1.p1 GENE.GHVR01127860.1~~GHVR01127860.1.p1  ORF type:complete len:224 (-),score=38.78 GHVR01127860.1:480-1151(-)